MNTSTLINCVAGRTGMTKKAAKLAVLAMIDTMSDSLINKDQPVYLHGFGILDIDSRIYRNKYNIGTREREERQILRIKFKQSKVVKAAFRRKLDDFEKYSQMCAQRQKKK